MPKGQGGSPDHKNWTKKKKTVGVTSVQHTKKAGRAAEQRIGTTRTLQNLALGERKWGSTGCNTIEPCSLGEYELGWKKLTWGLSWNGKGQKKVWQTLRIATREGEDRVEKKGGTKHQEETID